MKKPSLKTRQYLDYNDCSEWVSHKLGGDIRDWFKTYPEDEGDEHSNDRRGDFWDYVLRLHEDSIINGCFFCLEVEGEWVEEEARPWHMKILQCFAEEFAEHVDRGCLEFWLEW